MEIWKRASDVKGNRALPTPGEAARWMGEYVKARPLFWGVLLLNRPSRLQARTSGRSVVASLKSTERYTRLGLPHVKQADERALGAAWKEESA